jgi:hypothetical protein
VVEPLRKKFVRDRLNHVETTFRFLALVQTDVLALQSLLFAASSALTVRTSKAPVKTASYYAAFFALLSGLATFKLASERFVWLNDIEEEIYVAHFGAHTGQSVTRPMFKKLMRGAKFYTCTADKRIITRGEPVPLVLLLEGTAVITAPSQSSWGVIGEEANKKRRGHSAPMIEIVRGRGFYGEISFVHSMTSADDKYDVEQKVNDYHLPRADVRAVQAERLRGFGAGGPTKGPVRAHSHVHPMRSSRAHPMCLSDVCDR